MASVHLSDDGAPSPPPGSDVLAEGALAQLAELHARLEDATALAERRRPMRQRLRRGWRRARRNGRRLHLYPQAFLRGYRSVHTNGVARADLEAVRELVASRRFAEATVLAAALLPKKLSDGPFLDAALEAFAHTGALTPQVTAFEAKAARTGRAKLDRQAAKLAGKLRELDMEWLPELAAQPGSQAEPGRILHLLKASMPYRQSGYTMRSQYIIESQHAAGLDPVVVTALGFPDDDESPATEVAGGITFHRLAAPRSTLNGPPDVYVQKYATAVAERMQQIRPSVIHAHSGHRGYEGALVALALGRAFDVPVVYEVRGFFESLWSGDTEWNERGETYARRLARETWCMRQADAVVTLSDSMKSNIVARGIPSDKVTVIPNGVDTAHFYPKARSNTLVERWGLGSKFVFGYVSNLDHRREGHELLISAAAKLRLRGIPAVAMIIGDGRRRAELEEFALRRRATESVIFTGRVPHSDVLDYYRLLDVFVVPRIDERAARLVTPLKPFEAMAAGVPLVVSDLPALVEIVDSGARGATFPAGEDEGLVDALATLHLNPQIRSESSQRSREWVVETRQWASNAQRYHDLYSRLGTASES